MPKKRRSKPLFKLLLIFSTLLASFFIFFYLYYLYQTRPVSPKTQTKKTVIIKKGASVSQIAIVLQENGLLRSPFFFKLITYHQNLNQKIQAGSFSLSPSLSTKELALALTQGRNDIWFTVPEGWRNEQIAQLASETFSFSEQEFLQKAQGLQGKLFPETYLLPTSTNPKDLINLMLHTYSKNTTSLSSKIQNSSFSETEILSLAAIVERETLTEKEKPIVAGILSKRLENDWPLQVDATLQYIKGSPGEWWPTPLAQDKSLSSLYNTYKNTGLPPQPIANPGLSSIKAVISPRKTQYWFYLHDSQGKIHYATNNTQHSANVQQYIH